jgi:hypothetical protein
MQTKTKLKAGMAMGVILLLIAGLFLPIDNDKTIQGVQGLRGISGTNGITTIITKTIIVNGTNGKDGTDGIGRTGASGVNGQDGKDAPVNTPPMISITNLSVTHCYPKATINFTVSDMDNDNLWILIKYNTDNTSKWTTADEYFGISGNYSTTVQFYTHGEIVYWQIVALDGSDISFATTEQVV